jgi:Ala-tRNA(Pro) deacylase
MATRRIREFLDGNHARYVLISHSPAYTTSQVAESAHVPGECMAKVVMVVVGGRLAMAVVPVTRDVDLELLREATGQNDARLADEDEFVQRLEGCQLGAAPPFGSLFGLDTYVDRALTGSPHIAFNAGTHTDVIVMAFGEYCRLAKPKLVNIGFKASEPPFHVVQC